jgi:hypothetical protein
MRNIIHHFLRRQENSLGKEKTFQRPVGKSRTPYGMKKEIIVEKYQSQNPDVREIIREHSRLMSELYQIRKKTITEANRSNSTYSKQEPRVER